MSNEKTSPDGQAKAPKQNFLLRLAAKASNAKYKKHNPGPAYAYPMGLWFTLFFVVPLIIIVAYSFMKRDVYGGVIHEFTLKAYQQIAHAWRMKFDIPVIKLEKEL